MSVLEVREATFSYYDGNPVFSQVNLRMESDERVALQAPSGFGKTTLCRCIAGYLSLDAGEVALDGVSLYDKGGIASVGAGANPVQLIWQHPEAALDPRLRIRSSLTEAGAIDDALLDRLGIKPAWLSRYPQELSGGEMQRCCIARALATHPCFLIADEISTMLDALTQVQIWEVILDYCAENNAGLLFVTHSPALAARLATRTVNLTQY